MNLLSIFPSRDRGGAEEYALKVAVAAKGEGWKVAAAFQQVPGTETLAADFLGAGIRVHPLELRERGQEEETSYQRRIRYVKNILEAVRLLREVRPSVVHFSLPSPTDAIGARIACGMLRIPACVTFQLVADAKPISARARRAHDWCRRRGQRWVAVSKANRELLTRKFQVPEAKVRVIHNGVRLDPVDPSVDLQDVRRSVRAEIGLPSDSQILLTVGRLAFQKGYDLLVPGIARVIEEHPAVRFVWVGEGDDRDLLEGELTERGLEESVFLTGFRDDVNRFLLAADMFVFPTRFEGLPFSLIEAMAVGLPVVASDVASVSEVVEQEKHGLLFSSEDPLALRDSLLRALGNPVDMRAMAERAKERSNDFSEERMLEDTLSLLLAASSCGGSLPREL